MPPKPKVSKEDILCGAMDIVREGGETALTAKALAEKLHCSTQPVFWHYVNMEELRCEVFDRALSVFGENLRRQRACISKYMAIGLNYIRFATEERGLFKLLFMSDFGKTDIIGADVEMEYILDVMAESENIKGEEAKKIYREMWIFSHGIATMIATGAARFSEKEISSMLGDVFRGLVKNLKEKE